MVPPALYMYDASIYLARIRRLELDTIGFSIVTEKEILCVNVNRYTSTFDYSKNIPLENI